MLLRAPTSGDRVRTVDKTADETVVVEHVLGDGCALVETRHLAPGDWPDDLGETASRSAVRRALEPLVRSGGLHVADLDAEVEEGVRRSVDPGWPVRLVPVDGIATPLPVWLRGPAVATVLLLPEAVVTVGAYRVDVLSCGLAASIE